jgi:hypothetical protein
METNLEPANKLKALFKAHMLDLDIESLMHLSRTNQMWCTVIVGGPIPVEVWSLEEPYVKWNSVSVPVLEIKHAAMFSQSYTNSGFVDEVTVEQSRVLYTMKLTLDPPDESEGEQDDNPNTEDEEEKRKREEEQENRGFFG